MFPSRIQFFLNYHEQIQWFLITSDQLQDIMKKAACTAKMRRFHFHVLISFILWINRNWSLSFCWMASLRDHKRSKTYLKKKNQQFIKCGFIICWVLQFEVRYTKWKQYPKSYVTVCTVVLKSMLCILGYLHGYKDGIVKIQIQCATKCTKPNQI